jgi:hypothetical protein
MRLGFCYSREDGEDGDGCRYCGFAAVEVEVGDFQLGHRGLEMDKFLVLAVESNWKEIIYKGLFCSRTQLDSTQQTWSGARRLQQQHCGREYNMAR